jgi:hypothetical protein
MKGDTVTQTKSTSEKLLNEKLLDLLDRSYKLDDLISKVRAVLVSDSKEAKRGKAVELLNLLERRDKLDTRISKLRDELVYGRERRELRALAQKVLEEEGGE